jgi:hypothetical protein
MIGGRGYQTLGPLCASSASYRALPPADQAHQLPAARAPPLP